MSKVLMKGNEALAEAAIRCGCRHYFGYPITPQTEVAAYMSKRMPKIGGVFLQAESEIAAINMVYGCATTGRRAMTSSSSPGLSLKAEGISYLAGADLPALIVNVQRCGPGLGGILPSQGDYRMMTHGPGHGDFRIIVLAPATVQEMADLTYLAFELGEKYRMPAMILADGTMGQMMEPVELPESCDSTVGGNNADWSVTGTEERRTHRVINSLYLNPDELEARVEERFRRYAKIEAEEARLEEYMMEDAEICIVSVGITSRVSKNAIVAARKKGIKVGMIRPITVYPFPKRPIEAAAKKVRRFLAVELAMGQLAEDVRLAEGCIKPVDECHRVGGNIVTSDEVLAAIEEVARKEAV